MRAQPEMEPWVHTDKSNIELHRSGTITRAFVLCLGSAAPTELKKCVETNNPGLAPWAMQECRPVGALCDYTQINGVCIVLVPNYLVEE